MLARLRQPSALDLRLFRLINRRLTHGVLDRVLTTLTHLGLGGVQMPLALAAAWVVRDEPAMELLGWRLVAGFLLSTALVHLVKRRVKRMRPVAFTDVRFLVPETRHGSFPSGHTATTFALAAVLAWHLPGWAPPLLALAAAVGYSRVYVGVHFLSDVLAAAAIGLGSGLLVATL